MQRPSTPRQRHRNGSQRSSSLQSRSSSEATFFSPRQTSPKNRRHHEETRGDAQHFYSLRAWKRWCLGAILRWELVLRAVFVEIPTMVFHRIEGLDKVVAFFFVYVMLQALAILWGFLFNVGAILGDNMISILMMPYVQAICVLLTHVSVIGIVLSFGRATWILTWQSTQNFPMIRRIIAHECRPQSVIVVAALPMLVLLPSLIIVPIVCAQAEDDMGSWTHAVCKESYLKFVTDKHPIFQRSLRLATNIAIWQFIQACLEILPRWRAGLSELSMLTTFVLGGLLFTLNSVGVVWGFEWLARHVKYHATPLSDLTAAQWELFGLGLLTAWILWFLFLTWCTSDSRFEGKGNQRRLVGFFERLKYTFVVGQAIIFFRACVHPDMGFVHAQLELTIINLLLPSIYVISLVVLRMMTQISWTSLTLNGPVSLVLASGIYVGSKMTQRPHSFFVVALFLFEVSLRTTDAVYTLSRKGRVPQLLQQMLQKTTASIRKPPTGHGLMKKMVMLAFIVLFVFVAVLAGFSVLSVLQTNAKWFPDATSIVFHDESTVEIHHTAIVKLHLGLANTTNKAMHVDIPRYASCSNNWNGLDIVDYALLAEAAYFDPLSLDIERFVSTVFNHDLGEIVIRLPALNTKTGSKLDFYEAFIPSLNTSVISVRGTDIWRFTDFIEDVKMFIEPVIFTILSLVFPTIRIWPDVTFSTLIELYGELIALFGLQHEFWYYHELLEYVASIQDRDVVLTGHSMGGGIARLVGSIVGKTSVTFSPPGFVQSYSKLVHDIGGKATKVDRANLHHRSVTVVPEYDPITLIDAQAGMIQKISCNTPHLSMQLSCHMLEGTLCNLLEHCGDARNRIASCKFEHKITSLTEDILPKLTAVMRPEAIVTAFMITSIIISVLFRRRRRKPSLQSEFMDDLSPGRGRQMSAATHRRHFANAPKQAGSQRRNSVI
ncbi:hypothetical protein Poli38472_002971 [Pythium oligandrum]|uniref:Fungal lipase-type domain-containing protein n=1 Tax=Pythium oligandrum TaxID=41045 RepID=A0A8K1FCC7_PYTOL|nr:hypothetical protein Poli38472_002971 [Pythium oligandrum]|eukprot:TMW57046.1 hypothetical protein Poli38472_002971 [Pythium oligandrum]